MTEPVRVRTGHFEIEDQTAIRPDARNLTPTAKLVQLARTQIEQHGRIVLAMGLRFVAAGASFAVTFIIARTYGAAVSGEYALFTQTLIAFSMIAVFGNEQLVVRRIAGALSDERTDIARLAYFKALRYVGGAAVVIAALLMAFSPYAGVIAITPPLIVMAGIGVLAHPLLLVSAAAVRATHRLVSGQALMAVQPLLMLAVVALVIAYWPAAPAYGLAVGHVCALFIATVSSLAVIFVVVRRWPIPADRSLEEGRGASRRLGMTIAIDTLALWTALGLTGALLGVADAGVFRVCIQIMTVVMMIATTYENMISPRFAKLFRQGDHEAAGRTHRNAIFFLLAIGGAPLILIAIFAEPILGLMGEEFREGATALRILALGQFAVIAAGPAGSMIAMNGKEAFSLKLAAICFVIVVPVMALMMRELGLEGAAAGVALLWASRYLGSFVYARRMVATG